MTRNKTIVTIALISLVSMAFMGCGSDDNPVAATPVVAVDTAPPAIPSNLGASFDGSAARISWDANTTDSDLAGFLVQKTHYNDGVVTLVGVPTLATSITDNNVLTGISVYHVLAVDDSGNESAFATIPVVKQGRRTPYELND